MSSNDGNNNHGSGESTTKLGKVAGGSAGVRGQGEEKEGLGAETHSESNEREGEVGDAR